MNEFFRLTRRLISFALTIWVLCLSTTSFVSAETNNSELSYMESGTVAVLANLSEPQPLTSPEYPSNIMGSIGWVQYGDINSIRNNRALSYSFTIAPDNAIQDFSVVLNWSVTLADLDIDFGRWHENENFVSLQQSNGNNDRIENVYIPRLLPGTYSIIIKNQLSNSGSAMHDNAGFGAIVNALTINRKTPFTINWAGKRIINKKLNIRAKLEGPYNVETGLMNDDLRTLGYIPESEPYMQMGWGGDGETIDLTDPDGQLSATGNDAIVDWIQVVLAKYTFDGYAYIDFRSALLQRDGDIVDINGGPVQFWNLPPGINSYHVAIQHRTHTTVISDEAYPVGDGVTLVDFTLSSTAITEDSRNPSRKLVNDEMVLWAGDVIRNGTIDEEDSAAALDARDQTGYLFEDVNMDGTCDAVDSSIISDNQGKWDWI